VSALKQAPSSQMGLGGFGTGNVVQLDGGKRIRLDDKVDYWPLTGVWRALEKDADGNAVAGGRGMPSALHFLTQERERAGRPVAMPVPQPSARRVLCDHCHQPAELHLGLAVYPDRKDLAERKFWVCWACDAWVGCPSDTDKPFGPLAKEELRDARIAAHKAFDPVWKGGHMSRAAAYQWLSQALCIPRESCQIGMLELDDCRRVKDLVWERYGRLQADD
jgi:hypothetical protein